MTAKEMKCMLCGKWHKIDSPILGKHAHKYYKAGGTYYLNQWETRNGKKRGEQERMF